MSAPGVYQLRRWLRRAETLERNAQLLTADMADVVGWEYEAAGENLTSQADDVVGSACNLATYLQTLINSAKARGK